jgi:mevalonate kinase
MADDFPIDRTRAFGKLILFGEHLVVYKAPAIVGAVSAYTDCRLEYLDAPGLEVVDNRPAVPRYKEEKKDEGDAAIGLTLTHLGVDPAVRGVRLTFGGDLCCASGIGASAAQVVSLARAIDVADSRSLTEDEINAAGYEGEKGYHGTPSGIDNTAATFGGLLRFRRTDGAPVFEKVRFPSAIRIVYASTGITASTTKVVGDVRSKKEADEAWFADIMDRYVRLVGEAERVVEAGDMDKLGELMDCNHALLQELTVSCKELDDLVAIARAAGAAGAKMSGTGRGGLMIALTPTEEIQNSVAAALEKLAPQVWKTTFA